MVDITIVNGVYKPTYNWGAPSCRDGWWMMMDGDSKWFDIIQSPRDLMGARNLDRSLGDNQWGYVQNYGTLLYPQIPDCVLDFCENKVWKMHEMIWNDMKLIISDILRHFSSLLHVFPYQSHQPPQKHIGPSHYRVLIPPGLAEASPHRQKSCSADGLQ